MYYKFKFNTIYRHLDDIGYLIYQKGSLEIDRVINESAAIFLDALEYDPVSIDSVVQHALKIFAGVDFEEIRNDIRNFLENLVEDGFLDKGINYEECAQKKDVYSCEESIDLIFDKMQDLKEDGYEDTQAYLEEYFSHNPKLLKFQTEITTKCNERCVHCYIPHETKFHSMSDEMFYTLLEESYQMGVVSFGISGGEPMLHPHFCEYIEALKKKDIHISILTNLCLLNEEHIQMFKDSRITIIVSLYSLIEEHHDSITQVKGSCKKTIKAIETLVRNSIPVQINCPLMKTNKDDFVDLIKWARKLNVMVRTDYCIIPRCDRSTDNLVNRIEIEDMQKILDEITEENLFLKKIISMDDYKEQYHKVWNDENGHWCGVTFTCCAADVYGNIIPCPSWSDFAGGNICSDNLNDIWKNSDAFNRVRKITKKDFEKCFGCENRDYCSICIARNANESQTKNPFEINEYFCQIASMNRKSIERYRNSIKK